MNDDTTMPNLATSLSFRKDDPIPSAAEGGVSFSDGIEDDFEFSVSIGDLPADSSFTADEIFSNGRILPVYPVFNRDLVNATDATATGGVEEKGMVPLRNLLVEDRVRLRSGSTSSSGSSEAEDAAATEGSYCVWNPRSAPSSPARCKKSSSTGASSRRWRLRDLVVGRSHSDGKEKFDFLAPNPNPKSSIPNATPKSKATANPNPNPKAEKGKDGKKKTREMDMVTAHRLFYSKEAQAGKGAKEGKRSFLPYREIGLFAGANGLNRNYPPF